MKDKDKKYETPQLIPMQDTEVMDINGGGVPAFVFILAVGLSVYAGVFLAQYAFYYNRAIGQTKVKGVNG